MARRRKQARHGAGRGANLAALTALITAVPLGLGALPAQASGTAELSGTAFAAKSDAKLIGQFAAAADKSGKAGKAGTSGKAAKAGKDTVTFWVNLTGKADPSDAHKAKGKKAKARAVYDTMTAYAGKAQAGLLDQIAREGGTAKSFWIANTVKVTGTQALAEKIAARPDVASLDSDSALTLPDPLPGEAEPKTDAVEWNIDRINAPKVWNELGVRGDGVVVASIDSGVQYDHPAVKTAYRGLKPDGSYDHNYNWFDPAKVCAGATPCDNNGHGTHTMGTMVGDDGGANQVGVAPGATWVSAKGCESSSCSRESLLASGQWVVAPTDLNGANPRPDLAPDVVNNSWGMNGYDAWYRETVQAWRDAGIFPAFSNGNNGSACNTSGSPGSYTNSYASGAFDINNAIATFSSRGTGESGGIKPDLAAPGVNVRSSWSGGGYNTISGTSMASPHTAGTVALMWSASPAIRGDVAETEKLLDQSAIDVDDTTCGGTAAKNNVFGEGRLDAYAAVSATPRGALGALSGTVTSGGSAVGDARLSLSGPMRTTIVTGADGSYTLPKLMAGDYTAEVSKFGYVTATGTVTVVEDQSVTKDFAVEQAPSAKLTGRVTTEAGPEAGATLVVQGTPVRGTTAADGSYALTLPVGGYDVAVTPVSRCASGTSAGVKLSGDTTRNIELAPRTDTFGTACRLTESAFPTGDTKLTMSSQTTGSATVNLPFPVALYGKTYRTASATTEGVLAFGTSSTSSTNSTLPTTTTPNGALYPFWDNLQLDANSGVYTGVSGTAPHRRLTVEWRDVVIYSNTAQRLTFSAVIGEDGEVSYHYKDIGTGNYENGSGATIGLENATGTDGLLYAYNEPVVTDGMSITFRTTKSAVVAGTVTDGNDHKGVEGATVSVRQGGTEVATATTGADGSYLAQVPATGDKATYDLAFGAAHYAGATAARDAKATEIATADAVLATGRVTADRTVVTEIVPADQRRARELVLTNDGSATAYTVKEKSGASWLRIAPAEGDLAAGGTRTVGLTVDTAGATPGSVLTGTLQIASESGRTPLTEVPVTVVVPAYQVAVDAGATAASTDTRGDGWRPDQEYKAGSYGYLGSTGKVATAKAISGTADPELYRSARQGAYEYRFDNLPDGVYQVDLGFAELGNAKPADRVMDVMAEGTEKVSNLDITLAAGTFAAHDRTFTVEVTDGQLNLRFVDVAGKTLVNSVRVSHRPDLG
ncbi:S8 family serine peptidase [Streptomyces laurentii]|uniref:S8 family serine peptidase n=1 Tax=Streptomyces laurentii TaxID=39478 RepID=UPI00369B36F7